MATGQPTNWTILTVSATITRSATFGLARPGENQQNRKRAVGISGRVGVSWHPSRRKWQAAIRKDHKSHYLGIFDTVDEAAAAYAQAKARIHTFNPVA